MGEHHGTADDSVEDDKKTRLENKRPERRERERERERERGDESEEVDGAGRDGDDDTRNGVAR